MNLPQRLHRLLATLQDATAATESLLAKPNQANCEEVLRKVRECNCAAESLTQAVRKELERRRPYEPE